MMNHEVQIKPYIESANLNLAASFFGSWWRADAAAMLTYTLPGMRFYYMWQFEGYKNKLDVHLR